jgi:hypothetical protein
MKADMKVKYKEQSRKQGKQIQVNLLTYYPSTLGPLGLWFFLSPSPSISSSILLGTFFFIVIKIFLSIIKLIL